MKADPFLSVVFCSCCRLIAVSDVVISLNLSMLPSLWGPLFQHRERRMAVSTCCWQESLRSGCAPNKPVCTTCPLTTSEGWSVYSGSEQLDSKGGARHDNNHSDGDNRVRLHTFFFSFPILKDIRSVALRSELEKERRTKSFVLSLLHTTGQWLPETSLLLCFWKVTKVEKLQIYSAAQDSF